MDLHTPYSTVSFRMTLSNLEWLSRIFNDTKRRAVSLRQLSYLFCLQFGLQRAAAFVSSGIVYLARISIVGWSLDAADQRHNTQCERSCSVGSINCSVYACMRRRSEVSAHAFCLYPHKHNCVSSLEHVFYRLLMLAVWLQVQCHCFTIACCDYIN